MKSLITFGPKYTVKYSMNKDSKGSFGPESYDKLVNEICENQ